MMRAFSLAEAAGWLGARPPAGDVRFNGVSTDTRQISPGDLFVALRGERFDGHRFLQDARAAGAVAAIVDTPDENLVFDQMQVQDTTDALGRLALCNRKESPARIVSVTGSSGKTTVKEMLAGMLSQAGETLATRGNLNNHIGVPLTLFRLAPEHRFGVIELGASGVGEIAHTVAIARPDVAIITNAGSAHIEGFGGYDQIVQAKGEIIEGVSGQGTVVLNRDDPAYDLWLRRSGARRVVSASLKADAGADYYAEMLPPSGDVQQFRVCGPDGWSLEISLALAGEHNVLNALLAVAAVRELQLDDASIVNGLAQLAPVQGRLETVALGNDCALLDDSYNANPASVKAALGVLAARPGKHIAVLGHMAELGKDSPSLHRDVGAEAKRLKIDQLVTVGPGCEGYRAGFGDTALAFDTHQQAIDWLQTQLAEPVTVLVKGSRSSAMDVVVEGMKNKVNR